MRVFDNVPPDNDPPSPFSGAVTITITAHFKNKPVDCDNVCAKLYIDPLKGRIIYDDTPEYVSSVTLVSVVDGKNWVEIEIK